MPVVDRSERQMRLAQYLRDHPFLTDEELSEHFGVSIQTIRLDRSVMGIPDVRERTRQVAEQNYARVRSISSGEIVGQLLDLELGKRAVSLLETDDTMVFEKTHIVRSHFVFSQADSLALAVIDADVAITGLANAKFKRPVMAGEKLVARAEVLRMPGEEKTVVLVETTADDQKVFRGKFVVISLDGEEETG